MSNIFWSDSIREKLVASIYFTIIVTASPIIFTAIFNYFTSFSVSQSISNLTQNLNEIFETDVSTIVYITLPLFLILLGFLLSRLIKHLIQPNPIKWDFENFIGAGGHKNPNSGLLPVFAFMAKGTNKSSSPITDLNLYLKLDRTDEKFDYYFLKNGIQNKKALKALPSGEEIQIVFYFSNKIIDPKHAPRIDPPDFIKSFTPLTFVHVHNGREYKYKFSQKKVIRYLKDSKVYDSLGYEKGPILN